jgi:O-antigen/teichoic acid export membrane protein
MAQSILIARLLGVEGFGIFGTITMFTSVINKFASFRMGELVIKYVGHYSEHSDQPRAAAIFKLAVILEMSASIIAFILIYLLAPVGARFLAKDASMANLFIIYGLIVLANLVAESSTGLLQIYDRFRSIAATNLIQSLANLLFVTMAYVMHGNLLSILLAYLASKAVGAISLTGLAFIEAYRRWGKSWWNSPLNLLKHQTKELFHFAISTNLSASLNLINKDSELLWVSYFRSPLETGYYKLALSLANMVEMPVIPLPQATYPELSRQAAHKNWTSFRSVLRQGSLLAGCFSLVAVMFLVFFGRPLISYFYKPDFLPAYPALAILLIGYLVANTFFWRRISLLALGKPDFPLKINLILAGFKVFGIIILVPRYGYQAAATLLAGFYLVGSFASVLKTRSILAQCEARK